MMVMWGFDKFLNTSAFSCKSGEKSWVLIGSNGIGGGGGCGLEVDAKFRQSVEKVARI